MFMSISQTQKTKTNQLNFAIKFTHESAHTQKCAQYRISKIELWIDLGENQRETIQISCTTKPFLKWTQNLFMLAGIWEDSQLKTKQNRLGQKKV